MAIQKMWAWLNETLLKFETSFSRKAAFRWFVIIVIGLMLRDDQLGVTSIIRILDLSPALYATMLHFFHADSWSLAGIRLTWLHVVCKSGCLIREGDRPIIIGDGVKTPKEARKMPAVKRLHQDSENSAKPAFMFGHLFGALGILVGSAEKMFCLPLSMTIQDGNETIDQWSGNPLAANSHVVRLIREACAIASHLPRAILLLDSYFLSVPGLAALRGDARTPLAIVTKAKMNAAAYERPQQRPGRGRPRLRGEKVKLAELFSSLADAFITTTIPMYGKSETVQYLCKDLLWGKKLYQELRFVLVKWKNEAPVILVSTDLTMLPERIIRLYTYRFKIETCFRAFKQQLAGFAYHFWSKSMPKLNHFAPTAAMEEVLAGITDKKIKASIIGAFRAIHCFVMLSCIAMGLLQLCALRFSTPLTKAGLRWMRTPSASVPSEATAAVCLRNSFFRSFAFTADLPIMRFIRDRQNLTADSAGSNVS